jgi:hypothetical protein
MRRVPGKENDVEVIRIEHHCCMGSETKLQNMRYGEISTHPLMLKIYNMACMLPKTNKPCL